MRVAKNRGGSLGSLATAAILALRLRRPALPYPLFTDFIAKPGSLVSARRTKRGVPVQFGPYMPGMPCMDFELKNRKKLEGTWMAWPRCSALRSFRTEVMP